FNAREIVLAGVRHDDFWNLPVRNQEAYHQTRDAFSVALKAPPARSLSPATRIIFLIHGIRDFADWQEKLAYEISKRDPRAKVVSVRYGYFNILQFLLSTQRRRCVRSFADLYIQELARTSNVQEVCVAAHSNGTYVLAQALRQYPDMRVKNVYLAG